MRNPCPTHACWFVLLASWRQSLQKEWKQELMKERWSGIVKQITRMITNSREIPHSPRLHTHFFTISFKRARFSLSIFRYCFRLGGTIVKYRGDFAHSWCDSFHIYSVSEIVTVLSFYGCFSSSSVKWTASSLSNRIVWHVENRQNRLTRGE